MATKAKSKPSEKEIREAYIRHLLTHGHEPASVFVFADELGITESDFYNYFSSFEMIEEGLWKDLMMNTLETLEKDKSYAGFTAREKLLAFYYTHLEVLKNRRSFVKLRWKEVRKSPKVPKALKSYREHFLKYAKKIVVEAINNDEIKERSFISDRYDRALWLQLVFVVDFWTKDSSKDFEQSDAAVEKAVNLSFELLSESTLDKAIDFAKFIWQSS
jgi:AcrR family transcriptional regulator